MNRSLLITKLVVACFMVAFSFGRASALPLDTGAAIVAIDGDSDANVTVDILSVGGNPDYQYGYFLNYDTTFNPLPAAGVQNFQGGDVIDFALYDGSTYYTLSGDAADATYSVTLTFANEVTIGSPQQPVDWANPYYYNANITWQLPSSTTLNTNELALNFSNNSNDGVAPVPEPGTLLLLGIGLLGLTGATRMRTVKK